MIVLIGRRAQRQRYRRLPARSPPPGTGSPSSRSFTDTRTPGARIRGHELLREFDVLRFEVRVVIQDVLRGCAPSDHLPDVANREAAVGKHGLATEDVVPNHELLLPLRKPLDARFDLLHRRGEL
jgi:hypothetical protein